MLKCRSSLGMPLPNQIPIRFKCASTSSSQPTHSCCFSFAPLSPPPPRKKQIPAGQRFPRTRSGGTTRFGPQAFRCRRLR